MVDIVDVTVTSSAAPERMVAPTRGYEWDKLFSSLLDCGLAARVKRESGPTECWEHFPLIMRTNE